MLSTIMAAALALSACAVCGCAEAEPPAPIPSTPITPAIPTKTVEVYGEFYTVREAYKKGYLGSEVIKYIDENCREDDKFTPLTEERKDKIIHDYKQTRIASSDDLLVRNYGSYDGGITVVWITDNYYYSAFDVMRTDSYYLYGDYNIQNPPLFYHLRVWRESEEKTEVSAPRQTYGVFYKLERACELGLWPSDNHGNYDTEAPGGQATEDKIIHDYLLQDIDFVADKKDLRIAINYYGEYNGNILVRIYDGQHYDAYDQIIPYEHIWVPFEK